MKRLLYILAIVGLAACNTKKPEPTQNYVAKPEDLASLNQRVKTPVVNPVGTSGALNPAHGQPGHRCDIAVGAPLNSTPTKATAPTVQTTSVTQPATITPQPTVSVTPPTAQTATVNAKGEKLNPAHGEPNHRCDIAVGAPLNSKPTQAVVSTPNPKVTVTPPAATTQAPLLNEKGQRLNPAHGQPNHRCDIAVGAPLT
ncbi:hypothetical protein EZ428_04900 [Pedobacter frigiditerrae]|uniref:Uncharacterized protein n=1 Tax=Pedobacter frigiditerrae TaxID=2530452 RepID=A0A4R0N2P9_9SPHI|nr:hypothetical protein [Pedobacter frigiditerrae]TCC94119.1 hypothetical protein EZ428_04900 [Pedobacter frigiditerrae]